MRMRITIKTRELIVFTAVAGVLLLAYHWIFSPFFPAANGGVGHDYSYFLPNLLDGYYWYLNNGPFSTPWFSPAFCGGVPAFPNPQNMYYSVPQWLSFATDPLTAVYVTMLLFAALGFAGFYLLLRLCFNTSQSTALLAAALFMFNGFFAHRLLIGHLTFHAFMLTPLIALLLLQPVDTILKRLFRLSLAGLLFAYLIFSGSIQLVLPIIVALLFIGILHGLLYGRQFGFWLRLSGAGLLGIALSIAKLTAALAFTSKFVRTDYQLPGAGSLWGLLQLAFETLFLHPVEETVKSVIVNVQWLPAQHEFEYGITLVPFIMLLLAAPFLIRAGIKNRPTRFTTNQWLSLGALLLILLLPLAVNYYTPGWNEALKQIPILRNSSILFRWFCIYIPIIILIAALALERTTALNKSRPWIAAIGIITVVIINGYSERGYYASQTYNPSPIVEAYQQAKSSGQPVTIDHIMLFREKDGQLKLHIFRNNTFILGASQMLCYEPLFGYRLEKFPILQLRPGPVQQIIDGRFNLKNPSCFLFGESNNCLPGDHFLLTQEEQAKAFTRYQPFEFNFSTEQKISNAISLATFVTLMLFLLLYPVLLLRKNRNP